MNRTPNILYIIVLIHSIGLWNQTDQQNVANLTTLYVLQRLGPSLLLTNQNENTIMDYDFAPIPIINHDNAIAWIPSENFQLDESKYSLHSKNSNLLIAFFETENPTEKEEEDILIATISMIGNVLVYRIIWSNRKLRTTTNILILSLTMSDIMTTIVNIPFTCIRTMLIDWPLPDVFCLLIPAFQVCSVYVSTFTMAAIGVHRFHSVRMVRCVKVERQNSMIISTHVTTRTRITIWIILIWMVSFILAIPHAIFNQVVESSSPFADDIQGFRLARRCRSVYPAEYEEQIPLWLSIETMLTQFILPILITAILYVKIAFIIQRQGRLALHLCDEHNRRRCEAKRRKQCMLASIVVTFVSCWLPLNIYHLLIDFHLLPFNYEAFTLLHLLAMCSVCINPFIYFLLFWKRNVPNTSKNVRHEQLNGNGMNDSIGGNDGSNKRSSVDSYNNETCFTNNGGDHGKQIESRSQCLINYLYLIMYHNKETVHTIQ
ncbi:neuropeptide Y receptor [Blomia tropicalis]|nr:neuropeptide Y receptor [Blomia tropicalis]